MATRTENGRRNTRKRYDLEFKLQALELLKENKGVFNRTAREIGISTNTLRLWYNMHGAALDGAERREAIAQKVAEKATQNRVSLMDQIHEMKQEILIRMYEILPTETNLDNLQKAFKTLCEIDGTSKATDDATPNQSLTLIQSLTQNFKNYESKTPLDCE